MCPKFVLTLTHVWLCAVRHHNVISSITSSIHSSGPSRGHIRRKLILGPVSTLFDASCVIFKPLCLDVYFEYTSRTTALRVWLYDPDCCPALGLGSALMDRWVPKPVPAHSPQLSHTYGGHVSLQSSLTQGQMVMCDFDAMPGSLAQDNRL